MIKISVVVPVYNVEKYIRQCLESIVNQTYKNLEIIVVNDGTKDNSMEIVEEFLSDSRLKVINKENGGLSSARNRGMEEATGDYILFVDSDDWLEENGIDILVKNLIKNIDILGANFYVFDEKNQLKNKNNFKIKYRENDEGKNLLLNDLESVVWNKLYKISFLKKNNIIFLENVIHEDEEFTFKCYMKAKNVKYIQEVTYNYRINRVGSIMNNSEKNKNDSIASLRKIINEIKIIQKNSDDYFIQLRSLLKQYKLEIKILNKKNVIFSKQDIIKFETIIENINFNLLSLKEKKVLKKELQALIIKKALKRINICNYNLWKSGVLTINITRKLLSRKLKEKLK